MRIWIERSFVIGGAFGFHPNRLKYSYAELPPAPSTMAKPYGQGVRSTVVTTLIGAIGLSGHAFDTCTLGERHAD